MSEASSVRSGLTGGLARRIIIRESRILWPHNKGALGVDSHVKATNPKMKKYNGDLLNEVSKKTCPASQIKGHGYTSFAGIEFSCPPGTSFPTRDKTRLC